MRVVQCCACRSVDINVEDSPRYDALNRSTNLSVVDDHPIRTPSAMSFGVLYILGSFFYDFGGKCANIFSTPLSRSLMFLEDLLESVSLAEPRHNNCFVLVSKRSTTNVPT